MIKSMNTTQKGFASIILIIALVILIAGGLGYFALIQKQSATEPGTTDDKQSLTAIWAPYQGPLTGYFVTSQSVTATYQECKSDLFPVTSPYSVDFGDGSKSSMSKRDAGYGIEGGGCFLYWHVSHNYKTLGTYTTILLKNETEIIDTEKVTIPNTTTNSPAPTQQNANTGTPSSQQNTNVQPSTNSTSQAETPKSAAVPTCTIVAQPRPEQWIVGEGNTVTLSWTSTDATSVFLYHMRGGEGGDIVDVATREGKSVSVSGSASETFVLQYEVSTGYDVFWVIAKGPRGTAVCASDGQKETRPL